MAGITFDPSLRGVFDEAIWPMDAIGINRPDRIQIRIPLLRAASPPRAFPSTSIRAMAFRIWSIGREWMSFRKSIQ